jgi:hypothetical protein
MSGSLPDDNEIDVLEAIGESENQCLDAEDVIDLIQGDDDATKTCIFQEKPNQVHRLVVLGDDPSPDDCREYVKNILASRQMIAWWELQELLKQ